MLSSLTLHNNNEPFLYWVVMYDEKWILYDNQWWPGSVVGLRRSSKALPKAKVSHSVTYDSLWPHRRLPTRIFCPWDSPGKNTGVGYHALLQGIFPTQELKVSLMSPALADYRRYHLGSPQSQYQTLNKGASLVTRMVKNLPAMQETWVWFLGWEDRLEKIMVTHSSVLAWKIPWTEEPGELQSME